MTFAVFPTSLSARGPRTAASVLAGRGSNPRAVGLLGGVSDMGHNSDCREFLTPNFGGDVSDKGASPLSFGARQQSGPGRRYVPRSLDLAGRLEYFTHRPSGDGSDACWLWLGTRDGQGYGRIHWRGRDRQAHRLSLELHLGRSLRPDEVTRHRSTCSKLCVRPTHLQPGSAADNNRDKVEAGRQPRGEGSASARLTESKVMAIRARGEGQNFEATGREFGITGRQVAYIVRGQRWRHLPLTPSPEARS